MKTTIALFIAAISFSAAAQAEPRVFDDVDIKIQAEGPGTGNGFTKLHVCSIAELERTKDTKVCKHLKHFNEMSGAISAVEFYRSARENGIEYDDAFLLVSAWEKVAGWPNGNYVGHYGLKPFDLSVEKRLNKQVGLSNKNGGFTYSVSLQVTQAAPKFQQFNAPAKIYETDMIADVLDKDEMKLKLVDYLWMTLIYYTAKDNAVWSQPLYTKSSPEFKALLAVSKELQADTSLSRAIRAYRAHVDSVKPQIDAILNAEQERATAAIRLAQAQQQAAAAEAKAEEMRKLEIETQARIAKAQETQARIAKQRRDQENARAAGALLGAIVGATVNGANRRLK